MLNSVRGDGLLVSQEGYDRAMQCLSKLDFANLDVAARSTSKWVAEVASMCGLAGDWAFEVVGTAAVTHEPTKPVPKASNGTECVTPVNDLGSMVRKKRKAIDENVPELRPATTELPAVNVLGAGMIRKKPKPAPS